MSRTSLHPLRPYKHFIPQISSLHRQAVCALYRALLSQCTAVPLDETDKDALKHIVRNRFEANRHLRSPRRLKLSFYAGYKALDYLDGAATGDATSVEKIAGYLAKVPEYLRQPPRAKPTPSKPEDPPYETPPEHQFFNVFPRETVKGKRKVPIFVRANHFAMVRWKKPQPKKLSRVLRQLIEAKQKNIDHQQSYEDYYIPMAKHEDCWDQLVRQQMGKSIADETWTEHATEAVNVIKKLSLDRQQRSMEMAHRMVEIVEKEQELADKEQMERERAAS